ncbi:MAG: aminomethyl transferase family protein [Acidobacteria bacterium]|nr:aminomethyl transferase family protein [Acidobacteriota bacterium]
MTIDENDYRAIRMGAAVVDLSASGKLRLSGESAIEFLNGLVSNDVKSLTPGAGRLVAFPNLQGRLIALARVYRDNDSLLLEVDEINREKIDRNLRRFVMAGNFFIEDQTDGYSLFGVEGPKSEELVRSLGITLANGQEFSHEQVMIDSIPVRATVHCRCGLPGFDLFFPREGTERMRQRLLEAGAVWVGLETFEVARIEAGVPREGIDAGEDYIILETGLGRAVSYTKGCYLGQEVIARIHWRGQPARQLRGLLLDTPIEASAEVELRAVDGPQAGRKVGNITSATVSPALGRPIALGYVHRHYLATGTTLAVWRNEEHLGDSQVVELPFLPSGT